MYSFTGQDFVTMKGVERADLDRIFEVAREMESVLRARTRTDLLRDKILGLMFYQVSTRTRISFESAMQRLGGGVVGFTDAKVTRAGDYYTESLHDTVRMMDNYADILVIRHSQEFAPAEAADITDVPVINAGDGYNEHPTQTLLDVYTILRQRGHLDNLCVGLVGGMDLRAMHSLPLGLAPYQAKVYFISPADARMPESWLEEYRRVGLNFEEVTDIYEVIDQLDAIYPVATKSPSYHVGQTDSDAGHYTTPEGYVINMEKLRRAKPDVIVMHSLPRTNELSTDVDPSGFAHYWAQAHYGVAVRMALLALLLGGVS